MRIIIDEREHSNSGNRILRPQNLQRQLNLCWERLVIYNKQLKKEKNLQLLGNDVKNLYYKENREALNLKIESLYQSISIIEAVMNHNYRPHIITICNLSVELGLDVYLHPLYQQFPQGDYLIYNDNGEGCLVETANSFTSLKDKIKNLEPIIKSKEMAEGCGQRFILLLIMPNMNLREYFNHEVSYEDYQDFRKILTRNKVRIKKLNLEK